MSNASKSPASITDWLQVKLDEKLAAQPNDGARYRLLSQQWNVWSERRRQFVEEHRLFTHPHYGHMHLSDYLVVLCMIDGAKSKLERQREIA